jgi:PAS domain S-box-containing protein
MLADSLYLPEYRCSCGKLLYRGVILNGIVEIKCKRCNHLAKVDTLCNDAVAGRYMLVVGMDGKIINASTSAIDMLGYSLEELRGKYFREMTTVSVPDCGKRLRSSLRDSVGKYFRVSTFQKVKSGLIFPVTLHLKMCDTSKGERFIVAIADTEPSRERTISQETNAIKSNGVVFGEMDTEGRFTSISSSFKSDFGYSPIDHLGTLVFDHCVSGQREELKRRFSCFMERRLPFRALGCKFCTEKGGVISLDMFFSVHYADDGIFLGYLFTGWPVDKGQIQSGSCTILTS